MILLSAVSTQGGVSATTPQALKEAAAQTAVVDLPPLAKSILQEVSDELRPRVAVRLVRIFLQGKHLLAPNLVSTITKAHPDLAVVVTNEAIKLFPESAYSIAKAAVAAAPENAVLVNLLAVAQNREQAEAITAGVHSSLGDKKDAMVDLLTSVANGERVESQDLAIVTVKFRIGGGRTNVPANSNRPELNRPQETEPQEVFEGVTQQVVQEPVKDGQGNVVTDGQGNPITQPVLVVQIDTGDVEVPEDLSRQEIVDEFDVILRTVLDINTNRFFGAIVLEAYVN